MRISNKHANVQVISYSDFTGGLNTTNASEMIAANELSKAVNVEIDKSTGLLKTCCGTKAIVTDSSKTFDYAMYDSIGNTLLVTDSDRKVYKVSDETPLIELGLLSGSASVEYTPWEDGIVIASGGRLQYYHEGVLETITDEGSPEECHCPFIKDGRVYVSVNDELHCSGVGDEHNWINDSNDSSSAQWLQIGYKDGGKIVGVCSMASDIVIFKSNRRAYHLTGSYPEWVVNEIGRQIDCKSFNSCISLATGVVALGANNMQSIQPTDEYGDMKASVISTKVASLIEMMADIRLRYMPSLNQVWLVSGKKEFLFLEVACGGFYHRKFNSDVVDAVEANNKIFVLKEHGLYVLDSNGDIYDEGKPVEWSFKGKTIIGNNAFLIKRLRVDVTTYFTKYSESFFKVGRITLRGPLPVNSNHIYHDYTHIYHNKSPLHNTYRKSEYSASEEVYDNYDEVFGNDTSLWNSQGMYRAECRQVDHTRVIKIRANGAGGMQLFNNISFDVVEV